MRVESIRNIEPAVEAIIGSVCDAQGLSPAEKSARCAALKSDAAAYFRSRLAAMVVEGAQPDKEGFPVGMTAVSLHAIMPLLRADVRSWVEAQP